MKLKIGTVYEHSFTSNKTKYVCLGYRNGAAIIKNLTVNCLYKTHFMADYYKACSLKK